MLHAPQWTEEWDTARGLARARHVSRVSRGSVPHVSAVSRHDSVSSGCSYCVSRGVGGVSGALKRVPQHRRANTSATTAPTSATPTPM